MGQEEIVIVLECLPDEKTIPRDIFCHFLSVYEEASKGIGSCKELCYQNPDSNKRLLSIDRVYALRDSVTNQIALADKELCRLEMERREQEANLEAQRKLQKKKAYRQIGNYFMRNYSETTHRQFKIWKDYIHE